MDVRRTADKISAAAALDDPSRRAVYEFVLRAGAPVSRHDVAAALGMARGTAAFHLDRLAREELLTVSYRRLSGRSGPGSGRPAKMYAQASQEFSITVPERRYELAGDLLAAAVENSTSTGEPVGESLLRVAAEAGRGIGAAAGTLAQALEQCGYEPHPGEEGSIVLGNCPFHRLARNHTATICSLNLELLTAVVHGTGEPGIIPVLDPAPGRCCVRILREAGSAPAG